MRITLVLTLLTVVLTTTSKAWPTLSQLHLHLPLGRGAFNAHLVEPVDLAALQAMLAALGDSPSR